MQKNIRTRLRVSKSDKGNWAIKKAACLLLPVTGLIGLGEKPPLEEVDLYLMAGIDACICGKQ